jgi:acyl-CoA dehydrogenase
MARLRDFVNAFIETEIKLRITNYVQEIAAAPRWKVIKVIEDLKPRASEAGLGNPSLPQNSGYQHVEDSFVFEEDQLTHLEYALCAEAMSHVFWALEVFNCSAPIPVT